MIKTIQLVTATITFKKKSGTVLLQGETKGSPLHLEAAFEQRVCDLARSRIGTALHFKGAVIGA